MYQKCHLLLKPALFWQQMAFLSHSVNPGKVREYPVASYFTCPEECPSSPLMEDSTSSRFPSMPQSRSHWVTVVHVLTRYPFRRGISVYAEVFLSFFFVIYLCELFVKITVNSFVRLFLLLVVYKCADFEFKPQSPYIKAHLIYLIIQLHVWYCSFGLQHTRQCLWCRKR